MPELKLECLQLAVQTGPRDNILERAEAYWNFIINPAATASQILENHDALTEQTKRD